MEASSGESSVEGDSEDCGLIKISHGSWVSSGFETAVGELELSVDDGIVVDSVLSLVEGAEDSMVSAKSIPRGSGGFLHAAVSTRFQSKGTNRSA